MIYLHPLADTRPLLIAVAQRRRHRFDLLVVDGTKDLRDIRIVVIGHSHAGRHTVLEHRGGIRNNAGGAHHFSFYCAILIREGWIRRVSVWAWPHQGVWLRLW